jgi:hypothetical protein
MRAGTRPPGGGPAHGPPLVRGTDVSPAVVAASFRSSTTEIQIGVRQARCEVYSAPSDVPGRRRRRRLAVISPDVIHAGGDVW